MKSLLKVSGLVKIFHHVSSTHIVTPLLDIFVPQLVATGLKNAISEEPENSDMNSWLDVAEQMIQDVDFEKGSIVILTRSENLVLLFYINGMKFSFLMKYLFFQLCLAVQFFSVYST